ncbi:MAG: MurR/RpiR family transcriptional regulator [Tissierellia bacterium]|nr:MurR/RpiR family transcriptional regulator [Tissierellia bacterium]
MSNKSYDFIVNIVSRDRIKLSGLEAGILERLKNSDVNIADIDINEFASIFYISNSTITRFSQKLGFNGFLELKYALHNEKNLVKYITQNRYDSIIQSVTPLDCDIVEFIKNLDSFKRIVIIGIGSSGLLANEFIYKMGELGLYNTDYAKEPYKIDLLAKSLTEKDLLICLSLSGENSNIIDGAKFAYDNGATILSISGGDKTVLREYSNYYIKTPNYSTHGYTISKAFPILLYIDIICEIYSNK